MTLNDLFRIHGPNPHRRVTRNQGIHLQDHRKRRNYEDLLRMKFWGYKVLPVIRVPDHPNQIPKHLFSDSSQLPILQTWNHL